MNFSDMSDTDLMKAGSMYKILFNQREKQQRDKPILQYIINLIKKKVTLDKSIE